MELTTDTSGRVDNLVSCMTKIGNASMLNTDFGCLQFAPVVSHYDGFLHSTICKPEFACDKMRPDWQNDLYRKPVKQTPTRKSAGSQKRERKDATRDSCRESSSTVDEEVANLVQKINNAASRNALKAAGKSTLPSRHLASTSSASSSCTTISTNAGIGSLAKCCRCTTASSDGAQPQKGMITSVDNSPTSTTIEPENKAGINSKLNELKVNELKLECKKRKLALSGSKYQIMERLRPYEDTIVADLEASRAKFAYTTATNNATAKFFTSKMPEAQCGVDVESVAARLDLSVIDAVASNTTSVSTRNYVYDTKTAPLRDNSESTVRDIINDYLQQQHNKDDNKNVAQPKDDAETTTTGCTSCERLENCTSFASVSNATGSLYDRELAWSCASPLTSAEMYTSTTRNNTATFSFAQMSSGGHFTLEEELINDNEKNKKRDIAKQEQQQKRPQSNQNANNNNISITNGQQQTLDVKSEQLPSYDNEKIQHQQRQYSGNNNSCPGTELYGCSESKETNFCKTSPYHKMLSSLSHKSSADSINYAHQTNARDNGEDDLMLDGCCEEGRFLVSGGAQSDDENPPRPIQFDPADPRSIANTLSNHEQMLSYQQKKIHELQRELAYSQQNLRHQQQMILMVKKTQTMHRDSNGRPQAQADFWLSQLDPKTLRNSFSQNIIQHQAQQQQFQMQVADHEQLIATEQRLQEQIHIDQCIEDIVRLIRQDPRTALLIVQLLRKYQLEHVDNKTIADGIAYGHQRATHHNSFDAENSRKITSQLSQNLTSAQRSSNSCARCCHNDNSAAKRPTPIVTLDDEDSCDADGSHVDVKESLCVKVQYEPKNSTKNRKRPATNHSKYSNAKNVMNRKISLNTDHTIEQKKEKRMAPIMMDTDGSRSGIDMEEIFRTVLQDAHINVTSVTPICAPSPATANTTAAIQPDPPLESHKSTDADAVVTAYVNTKWEAFKPSLCYTDKLEKGLCASTDFSKLNFSSTSFGSLPTGYNDSEINNKNALNNFVTANIMKNNMPNQLTKSDITNPGPPCENVRFNHSKADDAAIYNLKIPNTAAEYAKNHAFDDLMDVLRDDQEKSSLGIAECDNVADFALGYTSDELVNFLEDENSDNFHANVQQTLHYANTENAQFNTLNDERTQHLQSQHSVNDTGHAVDSFHPVGDKDVITHHYTQNVTHNHPSFANNNSTDDQQLHSLRQHINCCTSFDSEIVAPASQDAASTSRDAFSSMSSTYSSIGGSNAPSDFSVADFNCIDDNRLFTPTNKSVIINTIIQTPNTHQEMDWLNDIDSIFDPEQSLFYYNQQLRPSPDSTFT